MTAKRTDKHAALAMAIIKERLGAYTQKHDFVLKADTIMDDSHTIGGAKVVLEIPYIYEN